MREKGQTMIDDELKDARERMTKSVEATRNEFVSLRTGRANPSLLDRINVQYYGSFTPLKQLAQVGAPEPRLLTVTPYDKNSIRDIERAIAESDLNLNPANDGNVIRLPIPELTQDRRKEMAKLAGKLAEDGKIAVRNIRRDAMASLKDLAKEIGEDEVRRAEGDLQKITDEHVAEIDKALKTKEAEIMEV
jgi:ribosome recycling factor